MANESRTAKCQLLEIMKSWLGLAQAMQLVLVRLTL